MREPHADQSVEVLVAKRNLGQAIRLLRNLWIPLAPSRQERWIALKLPKLGQPRVLVHWPLEPFFRLPFRESIRVVWSETIRLELPYPNRGDGARASLSRDDKREDGYGGSYYNASHFIRIVNENPELDLDKAVSVAEHIGVVASQDLRRRVNGLSAGEKFVLQRTSEPGRP